MDWEEIDKTLCTKINDYTGTKVWPLQDKPGGASWIEFHILNRNEDFCRRSGPARGDMLFQVSIFTTTATVYAASVILKDISTLLALSNLKSTNYLIRCENIRSAQIPQSGHELKGISHVAVTVTAKIWKLN